MENQNPFTDTRPITTHAQLETLLQKDSNDPRIVALMDEIRERTRRTGVSGKAALRNILAERRDLERRLGTPTNRHIANRSQFWGMAIGVLAGNVYLALALDGQPDHRVTWTLFGMLNMAFACAPVASKWFAHKASESGFSSVARGSFAIVTVGILFGTVMFGGLVWAVNEGLPLLRVLKLLLHLQQ